jgi:hypothetical protein
MQNIVGLIEIDSTAESASASSHSRPLAMLLALAELLPEAAAQDCSLPHPGHRMRMCSISPPVVFARVDVLRRELDAALADLMLEIEGPSQAA